MQHVVGIIDDRIDLAIILLHVELREFEQLSFRLLHQLINILRRIKSLLLHSTGVANEVAGRRLLRNDAGMVFDMCSRDDPLRKLCQINGASGFFKMIGLPQLLADGEQVEWLLLYIQPTNCFEDQLMTWIVEAFRFENLTHLRIGVFFQQQGTEHHALEV